jgi:undecaprenyl diphosphate synthase
MPYTSSSETVSILKRCPVEEFHQNLYVNEPVDLLVRTSGEKRLSDFLLWQVTQSGNILFLFLPFLWPEFGIWNFVFMIFRYQLFVANQKQRPGVKEIPFSKIR